MIAKGFLKGNKLPGAIGTIDCRHWKQLVAVMFRENDLLNDFLDRMLLRAYEQAKKQTGSHSKAARLFRTDRVSLYQRIAKAKQRINGDTASEETG